MTRCTLDIHKFSLLNSKQKYIDDKEKCNLTILDSFLATVTASPMSLEISLSKASLKRSILISKI